MSSIQYRYEKVKKEVNVEQGVIVMCTNTGKVIDHSFYWGCATAACQIEGGVTAGGRGFSIWDAFARIPGRIRDFDTPDIACDSYNRYKEDVALLKRLGVNAYRFSISWSRILPTGRGAVAPAGIAYYNELIDELTANGITPFVTLYHWDLPLDLCMARDGWLKRSIVQEFADYAEICFDAFGDRVKHWLTFNEAWCASVLGYGQGVFAPGRVSATEPYLAAHHILLSHAAAVQVFRQGGYEGVIGLTNNCDWREPLTSSEADRQAAQRALEFFYGWFTDPVVFGDYPAVMRERVGQKLPEFTPEEKVLLKGSVDFLGLNHYTTLYASANPAAGSDEIGVQGNGGLSDDQEVFLSPDPAWERNDMGWAIVPWGFRKMLCWIRDRYGDYPIYVMENGCAMREDTVFDALQDDQVCRFMQSYIGAMREAQELDRVPVAGYFWWSLLDNFEWAQGYSKRLGLARCSPDNLERVPKQSFFAYQKLLCNDRHAGGDQ